MIVKFNERKEKLIQDHKREVAKLLDDFLNTFNFFGKLGNSIIRHYGSHNIILDYRIKFNYCIRDQNSLDYSVTGDYNTVEVRIKKNNEGYDVIYYVGMLCFRSSENIQEHFSPNYTILKLLHDNKFHEFLYTIKDLLFMKCHHRIEK
jgi:hypothetical protein